MCFSCLRTSLVVTVQKYFCSVLTVLGVSESYEHLDPLNFLLWQSMNVTQWILHWDLFEVAEPTTTAREMKVVPLLPKSGLLPVGCVVLRQGGCLQSPHNREGERIQKFYDSIHHPYWPSLACSRLRCLHLLSGCFSLPRLCYDAGWKSLLYLCHLRLSHCHHATLRLLFCGGTKILQAHLRWCCASLAPFRIITRCCLPYRLPIEYNNFKLHYSFCCH